MKTLLFIFIVAMSTVGCSVKHEALEVTPQKVSTLSTELMQLGDGIDYQEARIFSYESLSYPKTLATQYGLVYPPTFHNFLINTGIKDRGLCYQWSEDMIAHLKSLRLHSFDLRWGVANKGEFDEHNSVVVVAKGAPFHSGILIDPWRKSGELYWTKLHADPEYRWVENKERSRYFGTIKD